MDKIVIPASITLERCLLSKKYKWKSENKTSEYKLLSKRAVIRFSCLNFANKLNALPLEKRQIEIKFSDNSYAKMNRINKRNISIQGYAGTHPYIQIIINRCMPSDLWERITPNKKSITFHISLEINLEDWKELNISPSDFLIDIEKDAKILLDAAIKKGLATPKTSKGREFDLCLLNPNNKEFIIAISSHIAKTKSRSKEKTIQKILMDISKMLPYLDKNPKTIPIVITRPIIFDKSWSFTTDNYLTFYKNKFGFRFLTTEFKNGWEDDIIRELNLI